MKLRTWKTLLATMRRPGMISIMRDTQSLIKIHFLYAALDSGLLKALNTPKTKEALIGELGVKRPELLDAILDLGESVGEIGNKGGLYSLKGKRSQALAHPDGDSLAATIEAGLTYYHDVYTQFTKRLRGAPSGDYLDEIGGVVARFSKVGEPFLRNFVPETVEIKKAPRILDVGCGSAVYLRTAHKADSKTTGIGLDMDEAVVSQAQANLKKWGIENSFQIVHGDLMNSPLDLNGSFDIINLFNMVYYYPYEKRPELFERAKTFLAPKGILAVLSNMRSNGKDPMAANLDMSTRSIEGCWPLPELNELTTQLRDCGFKQVERKCIIPGAKFYGLIARL